MRLVFFYTEYLIPGMVVFLLGILVFTAIVWWLISSALTESRRNSSVLRKHSQVSASKFGTLNDIRCDQFIITWIFFRPRGARATVNILMIANNCS